MNLILLRPGELDASGRATLTGTRASHLLAVLRVTPGDVVRVGVVDGPAGRGVVEALTGGEVTLRCELEAEPAARPPVDLLLALPRPKVMQRLWAQLAALGVGRIILTNAERVERCYFDTHVLTPAVYEPLLIEGLQQARDTWLPRVSIHRQFRALVEDQLDALSGDTPRLVAQPGSHPAIGDEIDEQAPSRVLLAIGPEGGWNDFELRLLARHRFRPVAMGPRTLRSDTACIALLSLAHDALRRTPADADGAGLVP